jgi:hypothetical protein
MKRKRVEQQGDRLPQTCCEARRHKADEASRSLSLQAGVAVFYGSSARFLVEPRRLVICALRER